MGYLDSHELVGLLHPNPIARIAEIEKGVASTKPRPQSSRFGGTPVKTLALVLGMHRARSQPIERSFIRAPHPSHLAHNIVNNFFHARLNRYCLFRKTANVGNHGRLIEIAIQLIMKSTGLSLESIWRKKSDFLSIGTSISPA